MANFFAPFGFADTSVLGGEAYTGGQGFGFVQQSNSTAIFKGDPLVRLASGYLTQATPGTTQIHGIAGGFTYISVSQGRTVFGQYYPGSDAKSDISVSALSLPPTVFLVQSGNGGPVPFSAIGQNINFQIGTGNTASQLSGAFADFATIGTSATLPFRITGLYTGLASFSPAVTNFTGVAGVNGSDPTTPFNYIYVVLNNADYNVTTGI